MELCSLSVAGFAADVPASSRRSKQIFVDASNLDEPLGRRAYRDRLQSRDGRDRVTFGTPSAQPGGRASVL